MVLKKEDMIQMYRKMLEVRTFEEEVYSLFVQGEVPGTVHQYQGQEAVAVGVCSALRPDDFIISTHRPHGHCLAKGMTMREIIAELYGRTTGCCKGKGGSMHIGDFSRGVLPSDAIVGANIPIAAGVALAFKLRKTDQIVVSFFGDGASNEGAFHEGINFAAVRRLPVVFVCENNLYGCSTPVQEVLPIKDIAKRAEAYGIEGAIVDGNDVVAVNECAITAVERARRGEGPTLIECKTYRYCGHSRNDPANYRPREELKEWQGRDPLILMRKKLLDKRVLDQNALEELEKGVKVEIQDAIEFARNSPLPVPEDALEDVYK